MRHRGLTLFLALLTVALLGATAGIADRDWYGYATLTGHHAPVVAVTFNEAGTRAASLDAAGTVCLWHIPQQRRVARVNLGPQLTSTPLKADETALALSPRGDVVAISAPALGTRIWRPGRTPRLIDVPIRSPWSPLVALSHDETMLATMSPNGHLRTWRTDTGAHIADYNRNPHAAPKKAWCLMFSQRDRAVAVVHSSHYTSGDLWQPQTGQPLDRSWRSRYPNSSTNRKAPDGSPYESLELKGIIKNVTQLTGNSSWASAQIDLLFAIPRNASAHGGGSYGGPAPTRHQTTALHLEADRALYDPGHGSLSLYRPARLSDMLVFPQLYLALLAALGFGIWFVRYGHAARAAPPIDPTLKAEPLPRDTRIAIVLVGVLGAVQIAGFAWSAYHDQLQLDLSMLLLPAAIQMWRKRSNAWRKFSVFCIWMFMLVGAAFLGAASTGQWLEYTISTQTNRMRPLYGALFATLSLALTIWLWWSLSRNAVRALFAAAAYSDIAAHLRQCVTCGYDIRATVAHGHTECPECGQTLIYDETQQQRIREEFEAISAPQRAPDARD